MDINKAKMEVIFEKFVQQHHSIIENLYFTGFFWHTLNNYDGGY